MTLEARPARASDSSQLPPRSALELWFLRLQLAEMGSVKFNFNRVGVIRIKAGVAEEKVFDAATEAGAEDIIPVEASEEDETEGGFDVSSAWLAFCPMPTRQLLGGASPAWSPVPYPDTATLTPPRSPICRCCARWRSTGPSGRRWRGCSCPSILTSRVWSSGESKGAAPPSLEWGCGEG